MTNIAWESLLREAVDQVQEVSDEMSHEDAVGEVGRGAGGDISMRIDIEAERRIVAVLERVSDVRIVAEESGESGPRGARWTVLIDPIDGSANFARQIPFYCTSIAVMEGDGIGDIEFGIVRNLTSGDTFFASKHGGAELNGRPARTTATTELARSCLGIDMSRATTPVLNRLVPLVASIYKQSHFGANALELCLLAAGRIDGFVDIRGTMRIMDLAAGYLIAREAGAVFSDEAGRQLDPKISIDSRFGVVGGANPLLHSRIIEAISRRQG